MGRDGEYWDQYKREEYPQVVADGGCKYVPSSVRPYEDGTAPTTTLVWSIANLLCCTHPHYQSKGHKIAEGIGEIDKQFGSFIVLLTDEEAEVHREADGPQDRANSEERCKTTLHHAEGTDGVGNVAEVIPTRLPVPVVLVMMTVLCEVTALPVVVVEVYADAGQIADRNAKVHDRDVHEDLPGLVPKVSEADVGEDDEE